MGDGPVDDALDACRFEDRHALHGATEPGHQALEIVGKQFAVGIPGWQPARRPGFGEPLALVDADQAGLLLLTQVGGGVGVAGHGEFLASLGQFRHRSGDQIVVLDVADGKVCSHHLRHLPGVAAGGVDHDFGNDAPLFRHQFPFAARQRIDAGHSVVPHYPGAQLPRPPGHRLAKPGRVGMTVVAGPGAGQHAFGRDKGIQPGDLFDVDDLHVVADVGGDSAQVAEPVHIPLGEGEADAAAAMPTDSLTGQLLQFPVQGDAVFVNLGEVVVAHQVGALTGRVPGRARRQLALLDQQDIAASLCREMVQQAHAHDAAADNNNASLILHGMLRPRMATVRILMAFGVDLQWITTVGRKNQNGKRSSPPSA